MAGILDAISHSFNNGLTVLRDRAFQKTVLTFVALQAILSFLTQLVPFFFDSKANLIAYLGMMFVLTVIIIVVSLYYSVRIIGAGLSALGLRTRQYGMGVKYVLNSLYTTVLAAIFWMDRRFTVALAVSAVVFLAIGIAAAAINPVLLLFVAMIGMLFLFAYCVVFFYHLMKLTFSPYFFVLGVPFFETPKVSWETSRGRTLAIAASLIVAGLVLGFVAFLPLMALNMLVVVPLTVAAAVNKFAYVLLAIYNVPVSLISGALGAVIGAYALGLFHWVLSDSGKLGGYLVEEAAVPALEKPTVQKVPASAKKIPASRVRKTTTVRKIRK